MKASPARPAVLTLLGLLLNYCLTGCMNVNLRNDEDDVRADLLKVTPLGCGMEDVLTLIANRKWNVIHRSDTSGFGKYSPGESPIVIGNKSIGALVGMYVDAPPAFKVGVQVFWGFDKEGKLIDIWVKKSSGIL